MSDDDLTFRQKLCSLYFVFLSALFVVLLAICFYAFFWSLAPYSAWEFILYVMSFGGLGLISWLAADHLGWGGSSNRRDGGSNGGSSEVWYGGDYGGGDSGAAGGGSDGGGT